MSIFIIYCLFAVTTSLTSLYELIYPVMRDAEKANKVPHALGLYYVTFFLINVLIAPLIFLSCIIPEWGIRFRETLSTALFEE